MKTFAELMKLYFLVIFLMVLLPESEAQSDLKNYVIPNPGTPSIFVFQSEPGGDTLYHLRSSHDNYLLTEIMNRNGKLVEHIHLLFDAEKAWVESYTTYTLDSAGRTTPLFTEIETPEYFRWNWEKDRKVLFQYTSPRKMDSRMSGIRVSKERILLPDQDSLELLGQMVETSYTNDLVRLEFIGLDGSSVGEDFYIEFSTWAKGLGLVSYRRQFSDGMSLNFELIRMMELE